MSIDLVLCDIDGVITRGEGQPADLDVIAALADWNRRALTDPSTPAVTLCTGRQAPYVELMAQMTETFQPCIYEHGAGLFFPRAFRYQFDECLGPDFAARLADLRAALQLTVLAPGRAFVQPGKEATMTLYPLEGTTLDELFELAATAVTESASTFELARNVKGIELRPPGIDKGLGLQRLSELLNIPTSNIAGIGDSDPDLSFLHRVAFSAAPANATPAVQAAVHHVAQSPYGQGLLEILQLIQKRNQAQRS